MNDSTELVLIRKLISRSPAGNPFLASPPAHRNLLAFEDTTVKTWSSQVMSSNLDNFYLDILGQTPGLSIYTQISLCYAMGDQISRSSVVATLTAGLQKLSDNFPWVAGQVVNDGGVFKIKPFEPTPRLIVKDLTHDPKMPTMKELKEAGFPMSMLKESNVAPRMTLPGTDGEVVTNWPVFLVQATFITGGLILSFVAQHQTMDMTGQGQIIDLLDKACRNEPFTSEQLSTGNLGRRDLIPLLDPSYDPTPDISHQITKPALPGYPASASSPSVCTWETYLVPAASISELKSSAMATLPTTSPGAFVSTDDAVSAFIWQSVMRARAPRLQLADDTLVIFGRAVNVRRYFDIPPSYPGLVQNMTLHSFPLGKLIDAPLGEVAWALRRVLLLDSERDDESKGGLRWQTRALATYMGRAEESSGVAVTASLVPGRDIAFSSWAQVDCYELDFGIDTGKPEAVRRPSFTPVESLMYLLPKDDSGEMSLAICLNEEDLERLKTDEKFTRFAKIAAYII